MGIGRAADTPGASSAADAVCAICDTYEIELCAILDGRCDIIGHAFIAIDGMNPDGSKSGSKLIAGFYPETDMDTRGIFTEGSGRVVSAPGQVRDDSMYYKTSNYLYADQKWELQFAQASAAHRFIEARRTNPGQYSVWTRQCNNFALDVLMRAGLPTAQFTPASGPVRPSFTYTVLSGRHVPAADWLPTQCLPVTREIHETVDGIRNLGDQIQREINRWNNPMNWINLR